MGAFDGLVPRSYLMNHSTGGAGGSGNNMPEYIKGQSAFRLFKGFGLSEFEKLINEAADKGSDTVWVPSERIQEQGRYGISMWYAQAVLDRLKKGMKV